MNNQLDLFDVATESWPVMYRGDVITVEQHGDKYRYASACGLSHFYSVVEWMMYNAQREMDIKRGRLILRES